LAAVREIVADDDFAALGKELRRDHTADVPGSSRNKNAIGHVAWFLWGVRGLSLSESQKITSRIEHERQRASEVMCSTLALVTLAVAEPAQSPHAPRAIPHRSRRDFCICDEARRNPSGRRPLCVGRCACENAARSG